MAQQHPQRNPLYLVHQFPILKDLDILELRSQFLNLVGIIERQNPLLDQLHARNPDNHLRTRHDGEDIVQSHWLGGGVPAFAAGTSKPLSIAINDYEDRAGDTGLLVAACGIDLLLEKVGCFRG
jgi:hypothetical protein